MRSSRRTRVVIGVIGLVAASLAVAVGGLAHRLLVFEARAKGAGDGRQGGRKPRLSQVLPKANRVFEDGLEVGSRHEDPGSHEDEREQDRVGQQDGHAHGENGDAVIEDRPLAFLRALGALSQRWWATMSHTTMATIAETIKSSRRKKSTESASIQSVVITSA
jgi:hypothetical protein